MAFLLVRLSAWRVAELRKLRTTLESKSLGSVPETQSEVVREGALAWIEGVLSSHGEVGPAALEMLSVLDEESKGDLLATREILELTSLILRTDEPSSE
ncbi:hypothetical protein [Nostocoides japonicum]|uniref:hypothetical protein n=1 Tax=Nostocoides japonicum TaxID=99481 RepID=UPI0012F82249|nr:hypothetical protein [Tetrasphaera japonica]